MINSILRPILRYPGGKFKCAPWIISHLPNHEVYVEVFGGGASVLLLKPRSRSEIYNDIDNRIVNVFRVLRDQAKAARLKELLELTPYSFQEYKDCYKPPVDDIDDARMIICRSFMGWGSDSVFRNNGFKHGFANSHLDSGNSFQSYLANLPLFIERLKNVVIENLDWFDLVKTYDSDKTLFYVDPPYLNATLSKYPPDYHHTFASEEQHLALAVVLNQCKGNVVLSGYESNLYSKLFSTWSVATKRSVTGIGGLRAEKIWIKRPELKLF